MASDHLVVQATDHVLHRELVALGGDLRMEDHLEEQIPKLFQEMLAAGVERVEHLIGLFEEVRLERARRLFAIPRASARPAEPRHDSKEALEKGTGGLGHVLTLRSCDYTARISRV